MDLRRSFSYSRVPTVTFECELVLCLVLFANSFINSQTSESMGSQLMSQLCIFFSRGFVHLLTRSVSGSQFCDCLRK